MCQERAVAVRQKTDIALSLEEREAGRAVEQKWLRFARLYALMDEILANVDTPEREGESCNSDRHGEQGARDES